MGCMGDWMEWFAFWRDIDPPPGVTEGQERTGRFLIFLSLAFAALTMVASTGWLILKLAGR
jgi:hypothetical protein